MSRSTIELKLGNEHNHAMTAMDWECKVRLDEMEEEYRIKERHLLAECRAVERIQEAAYDEFAMKQEAFQDEKRDILKSVSNTIDSAMENVEELELESSIKIMELEIEYNEQLTHDTEQQQAMTSRQSFLEQETATKVESEPNVLKETLPDAANDKDRGDGYRGGPNPNTNPKDRGDSYGGGSRIHVEHRTGEDREELKREDFNPSRSQEQQTRSQNPGVTPRLSPERSQRMVLSQSPSGRRMEEMNMEMLNPPNPDLTLIWRK